ncbi:MAG: hypothetical protein FJ276_02530 [Planctomycetes bacterium]|nr:hypothetical protein [Planctomycetota bacterium]
MLRVAIVFLVVGCAAFGRAADQANLVANGSFEDSGVQAGVPAHWSVSGNQPIKQQVTLDAGRDGNRCGKLECSAFVAGGPANHAMICQVGQVQLRKGQWYRLTLWAKAAAIEEGAVEIAVSNMDGWENGGLADALLPQADWAQFEFLFRAKVDVPAASSRLQFYFHSTGTLWLDDVVLTEWQEGQRWFPTIATDGVKNFVPNSSFECGSANWGSFTWGLGGWAGNLYRLEGVISAEAAQHGRSGWQIALDPRNLPVYWFDYYEPVRQPVRRVLVANRGWFQVRSGDCLTLSAWLRADAEGVMAQLVASEASGRLHRKAVSVGPRWQRYEFTFAPAQPYLFIAVGLDLEASQRDAARLSVDAVQLERGDTATDYEPRHVVESYVETEEVGNMFRDVGQGATFHVRAYNDGPVARQLAGQLSVTDFFDRVVAERPAVLLVPARSAANQAISGVCQGRSGFFRAQWKLGDNVQSLRCAILEPAAAGAVDSPLGFNHAYPWDFLVRLTHEAGIVWWRDWSAKWQTVEPERARFDFAVPDEQIRRVLRLDGQVEVLLPFPSTSWSTAARQEEIDKAAPEPGYPRSRLPLACAPRDLGDFASYAAEVVRRYSQEQPHAVTHYQLLNEPIYTSYALPRQFGYQLADYLKLLEAASRAMKAADSDCVVVGGISANLRSDLTNEFVVQGGLRWVDVVDLHLYDPPRPAETFEAPFRAFAELMRAHGGPKPVWITEWGCYADDDPPSVPHTVGDETMNRCRWSSERAATEHIVKFTAISFAHGVRKIFFHAGTCGPINGSDAGGVLFEYGGAPRKMYAGASVLTRLLGVPQACERVVLHDGIRAYVFRTGERSVAIAWRDNGQPKRLRLAPHVVALDIMGNALPAGEAELSQSPVYLVAPAAEPIARSLQ